MGFLEYGLPYKKSENGIIYGVMHWPLQGVEGVVRGLEGTHPADSCIPTKLE
jgi:hypothetical protein